LPKTDYVSALIYPIMVSILESW